MAQQEMWFETTIMRDPRTLMFSVVEKATQRLLGATGLCYLDAVNRSADFSLYIGADDLYIDEAFAPDASHTLLRYGFDEMNLHRIWSEIYCIDVAKQKLLVSLGFHQEGRHRHTHWSEGNWFDSLFYGLLIEDHYPGRK
jgi:RimJ/RimL family protein N-acetyltransferase